MATWGRNSTSPIARAGRRRRKSRPPTCRRTTGQRDGPSPSRGWHPTIRGRRRRRRRNRLHRAWPCADPAARRRRAAGAHPRRPAPGRPGSRRIDGEYEEEAHPAVAAADDSPAGADRRPGRRPGGAGLVAARRAFQNLRRGRFVRQRPAGGDRAAATGGARAGSGRCDGQEQRPAAQRQQCDRDDAGRARRWRDRQHR